MKTLSLALAGLLAFSGCHLGNDAPVDPESTSRGPTSWLDEAPLDVASISGFVWDPEAFWFTMATCGPTCLFPPLTSPGIPAMERAEVKGAVVDLFDPAQGRPAFRADAPTDENGGWKLNGVTSRPGPPYLAVVSPPPPGTVALKPFGPPTLPTAPAADYLPTFVQKPIFTSTTLCMFQSSPVASTNGILAAVALYLTAAGTPTTVPQLIDPTVHGGVGIVWLFQPGPPPLRVPAFGTRIRSNVGTVLHINWAPPDAPLPPPLKAIQSPRGFFVDEAAPSSDFGIGVVLLPVGSAGPAMLTLEDPVTDAATGRPWTFAPLPPLTMPPGLISYLEYQSVAPGGSAPPEWICVH